MHIYVYMYMIIHFNSILSGLGVQHCAVAGPIKKKQQQNRGEAKCDVELRLRLTATTGAYVPGLLRPAMFRRRHRQYTPQNYEAHAHKFN